MDFSKWTLGPLSNGNSEDLLHRNKTPSPSSSLLSFPLTSSSTSPSLSTAASKPAMVATPITTTTNFDSGGDTANPTNPNFHPSHPSNPPQIPQRSPKVYPSNRKFEVIWEDAKTPRTVSKGGKQSPFDDAFRRGSSRSPASSSSSSFNDPYQNESSVPLLNSERTLFEDGDEPLESRNTEHENDKNVSEIDVQDLFTDSKTSGTGEVFRPGVYDETDKDNNNSLLPNAKMISFNTDRGESNAISEHRDSLMPLLRSCMKSYMEPVGNGKTKKKKKRKKKQESGIINVSRSYLNI